MSYGKRELCQESVNGAIVQDSKLTDNNHRSFATIHSKPTWKIQNPCNKNGKGHLAYYVGKSSQIKKPRWVLHSNVQLFSK